MAVAMWEDALFLLGGTTTENQLMSYSLTDWTFTNYGDSFLDDTLGNTRGESGYGGYFSQIDHTLYTISNDDTQSYIHSYRLDTGTPEWDGVAIIPVDVRNTGCLAATTTPFTRLFVTGGGHWTNPLNTVQVLDVVTNSWIEGAPSMQNARAEHGCIVLEDTLYVVGGGVSAVEALFIDLWDITSSGWRTAAS